MALINSTDADLLSHPGGSMGVQPASQATDHGRPHDPTTRNLAGI
jgi:hypothetical protein